MANSPDKMKSSMALCLCSCILVKERTNLSYNEKKKRHEKDMKIGRLRDLAAKKADEWGDIFSSERSDLYCRSGVRLFHLSGGAMEGRCKG